MPASKNILVCAYAFSPTLGSEFAQGWNYVQNMKATHKLTVLVGSSDGRMGDFTLLDHESVRAIANEVEIITVKPDWFCKAIKWLDVSMRLHWLFVFGLRRWHWLAFQKAVQLKNERNFDAVHQLGPVGFRNPGYLHRLGIPSYWGPIGGFQYINLRMAFRSSTFYGLVSIVRNISTYFAARSSYVASAVRGFSRLSFATETNRRNFARLFDVEGPVLSDQATTKSASIDTQGTKVAHPPLRVIWCGTIDARKNIRLLIAVAALLQQRNIPAEITVIGSGGMLNSSIRRSMELQLTNLHFTGQIPRPEVQTLFQNAHILCFTSLSEANTSTFFEALEAGCIPVALDLDGFSSNIKDGIGFKIPIESGWSAVVEDYVSKLEYLTKNRDELAKMANALSASLPDYGWGKLSGRHAEILNTLITDPHHDA